jgi:hypothetical protein
MRIICALFAFAILIVSPPATDVASADTTCFSVGSFSATYAADGMHVHFTLISDLGIYDWLQACWPATPLLVQVMRRDMSQPCDTETSVTFIPWANQQTPFVTADFLDADVQPNHAYHYFVYGIDGQGGTMPASGVGNASTGVALICRGTLSGAPDCGVSFVPWITPCDEACLNFLSLTSWPPEAVPYFNTTTTLEIYGEFDGLGYALCNVVLPAVKITSVVESSCVSAVESSTWGAVKARYR